MEAKSDLKNQQQKENITISVHKLNETNIKVVSLQPCSMKTQSTNESAPIEFSSLTISFGKYGHLGPKNDRLVVRDNGMIWFRNEKAFEISSTTINSVSLCLELQLIMIRPQEHLKQLICQHFPMVKPDFKWIFIFVYGNETLEEKHLHSIWKSLGSASSYKRLQDKKSALTLLQNNAVPVNEFMNDCRKRSHSPEKKPQSVMNSITAFSNKCLKLLSPQVVVKPYDQPVPSSLPNVEKGGDKSEDEVIILDDDEPDETEKTEEIPKSQNAITTPITLSSSICTQPVFEDKPFILDYYSTTITDEEVLCLQPLTFVNDNLINFYLRFLYMERLTEAQRLQAQFFNCFFYTRLAQTLTGPPVTPKTGPSPVLSMPMDVIVTPANTGNILPVPVQGVGIQIPVVTVAAVKSPVPRVVPAVTSANGSTVPTPSDRILRSSGKLPIPVVPQPSVPDLPKSFNEKKALHAKIDKWTRKMDLFEKDFVIIPINENSHWYLALICFPWMSGMVKYSNDSKDKSNYCQLAPAFRKLAPYPSQNDAITVLRQCASVNRESDQPVGAAFDAWRRKRYSCFLSLGIEALPCVLIFDSLPASKRTVALRVVRNFLKLEWDCRRAHMDGDASFDRETVRGFSPKVPSQSNLADCGIYLLHYVEMFFKNPLTNFTRDYFQSSMSNWFRAEHIGGKRQEIRDLIMSIYERNEKSSCNS